MTLYRNLGKHDVLGHAPGEVFETELDPVTEARLVGGGHLGRAAVGSTTETGSSDFASSSSSSLGAGSQALQSTPTNASGGGDADTHDDAGDADAA